MHFHSNEEINRLLLIILIKVDFLLEPITLEDVRMNAVMQIDSFIETIVKFILHGRFWCVFTMLNFHSDGLRWVLYKGILKNVIVTRTYFITLLVEREVKIHEKRRNFFKYSKICFLYV